MVDVISYRPKTITILSCTTRIIGMMDITAMITHLMSLVRTIVRSQGYSADVRTRRYTYFESIIANSETKYNVAIQLL